MMCVAVTLFAITVPAAYGGNNWNKPTGGTQWWFDPTNWSVGALPPTNSTTTPAVTDTDVIVSTDTLPGGEGIVFDPSNNDPNFANAINLVSQEPAGFGPQYTGTTYTGYTIQQLYLGRKQGTDPSITPVNSMVTLKGDLTATGNILLGRSSGTRDVAVNATLVQKSGTLLGTLGSFDLGQVETTQNGYGNATYDYQGGTADISRDGGSGLRLSQGSSSNALDGAPAGASGIGKLIMHNPATPGYFRTFALIMGGYGGVADGAKTSADPDGVTKGVSVLEFHYQNGGTRPIQVSGNLQINNGKVDADGASSTFGVRSARLGLLLDSAPTVTGGVPQNLPLIDVDWARADRDITAGSVTGTGDLNGDGTFNNDRVFSDEFAANPLLDSASLRQDSIVSAVFGSTKYNWKISYTGLITYTGGDNVGITGAADTSSISSIAATGGLDVVLMGLSTESITPPGVPGDYNGNGVVDAADYTVWRDHLGQSSPGYTLQNEGASTGTVDASDYDFWKAHFGASGAGASVVGGGAVPEPSTLVLALVGVIGVAAIGRRKHG